MKYLKKIIIINILIIMLLFAAVECLLSNEQFNEFANDKFAFLYLKKDKTANMEDKELYNIEEETVKRLPYTEETYIKFCGEERIYYNYHENNKKPPIFVLGCSYTYGHGLKKEESFPSILAKSSRHPVYNFSNCGEEAFQGIKRIQNHLQPKNREIKPKYVIYVYMHDHINRYLMRTEMTKHYEELYEINKLEKVLLKTKTFRYILANIKKQQYLNGYPDNDNTSQYLKKVILLLHKKIKRVAPEAQFIVILYNELLPESYSIAQLKFIHKNMNSQIWKEIQEETDTIVIQTKDIMGFYFDKNYKLEEDFADWHPNSRAWAEFTPKFVEKYIDND